MRSPAVCWCCAGLLPIIRNGDLAVWPVLSMRLFAAVDIIRLLCQCLPGAMPVVMEPSSQELATLERCGSPEMAGCFSARVRGRLFAIQRVDMA